MKNYVKVIIVLIIIIIGVAIFSSKPKSTPVVTTPTPTTEQPPAVAVEPIKGCYVAHLAKDVYSLNIASQDGEAVAGTLVFKNFEKDSSAGTFSGSYKDGILVGEYLFNSEGMTSDMQVAFKKSGTGFVRGYGDMDSDGTHFKDMSKITYDPSYVFQPATDCATSLK